MPIPIGILVYRASKCYFFSFFDRFLCPGEAVLAADLITAASQFAKDKVEVAHNLQRISFPGGFPVGHLTLVCTPDDGEQSCPVYKFAQHIALNSKSIACSSPNCCSSPRTSKCFFLNLSTVFLVVGEAVLAAD